ncbi:enoyl-CoA hydratase [Cupriavidus sp. TA19]|uniref:enoyl-CoA hydratase/isomerase family protein n=1 Tax=unclassified Cupriavidus TaxID=2640874 RepID=UPI000E2E79EA|nr:MULTISPECIES: enoyl-CoA hydratase/isomerase family protein [unclassified Cupriavidus]BDB27474.1 enoyl-CoA hydratase/isomerase family protein [Cupriavidus sp. P-10]GLC93872.1 enoyl-CoA hydratase [Cupriavidus sp. TA19]
MSLVTYTVRDHVAEILLDNAPVNALTIPMVDALIQALQRAAADDAARAVIIASKVPGRFCAGLDISALQGASAADVHALLDKLYVRLSDAQYQLGKPSIAAVAGAARGGGMTVAISCDLIVAAGNASFGYPEIDVGMLPAIHFTHLPRIVGRHVAFDLLFTGRTFDAAEAHALHLVNRLVAEEEVLAEARRLARTLASKSRSAMTIGRAAFHRAADSDYRRGVSYAVDTFCQVAATDDAKEGIAAFVEKRRPQWRG